MNFTIEHAGRGAVNGAIIGILFGTVVVLLDFWRKRRRSLAHVTSQQPDQSSVAARLVAGVVNSNYYLTSGGGLSSWYWDYDRFVSDPSRLLGIVEWFSSKISELKTTGSIDGLVFIERDSGPIGLLGSRDLLSARLGIPSVVYRELREIDFMRWKGACLRRDANVVVVSDVATAGRSASQVVDDISSSFGAKCVAVIVVVDRCEGAHEMLRKRGVSLFAMTNVRDIEAAQNVGDTKKSETPRSTAGASNS